MRTKTKSLLISIVSFTVGILLAKFVSFKMDEQTSVNYGNAEVAGAILKFLEKDQIPYVHKFDHLGRHWVSVETKHSPKLHAAEDQAGIKF